VPAQELSTQAEIVAWACFIAGLVLLASGVAIGLYLTFVRTKEEAKNKAEEAKDRIDELKQAAASAPAGMEAGEATDKAEEAKSVVDEFAGLISSLPETMRFPGLLILVGTLLMSVATVQFGGVSFF
jgi:hypothetical protein